MPLLSYNNLPSLAPLTLFPFWNAQPASESNRVYRQRCYRPMYRIFVSIFAEIHCCLPIFPTDSLRLVSMDRYGLSNVLYWFGVFYADDVDSLAVNENCLIILILFIMKLFTQYTLPQLFVLLSPNLCAFEHAAFWIFLFTDFSKCFENLCSNYTNRLVVYYIDLEFSSSIYAARKYIYACILG